MSVTIRLSTSTSLVATKKCNGNQNILKLETTSLHVALSRRTCVEGLQPEVKKTPSRSVLYKVQKMGEACERTRTPLRTTPEFVIACE